MAWYHTYFNGLPQKAWKLHQDEEYTEFEIDFLRDVLEIQDWNRVLDVMSGYGRHAIPLADDGIHVTCIDLSEEYCSELQWVASKNKLPLEVFCADILDFDFEERQFNAAYCFGNSFSFFPRNDLQKLIEKIAATLVTGGHFAIHTENLAESIFPNFQSRNWMPVKGGITYLAQNDYNAEGGYIEAEQTFISGAEKVTHQVRQHIYTLADLCDMFYKAGLEVTGTFANLEADSFQLGDEQLYLIAKKR